MISPTLSKRLDEIGRRHRRVTTTVLTLRSLFVAWIAATLIRTVVTMGWQRPSPLTSIAFFLVAGAVSFAIGYRPPLDRLGLARLTDRRLQLKDRLATAVEWSGQSSPLVAWLLQDADQHARFADPRAVVPLPFPSLGRGLALMSAFALSVALWSAPLPSGLMTRSAQTIVGGAVSDEESEILRQIASLRDLISEVRTAEARRLDRDLAQLHAGLRDRSIPKDEAVALLKHFERRAQSAFDSHAQTDHASDELGLERIQQLAERLTVVHRQDGAGETSGGPGQQPVPYGRRELSESEIPPELLEVLRHIGEESERPGEQRHPGSAAAGDPAEQSQQSSDQSATAAHPDQPGGQRGSMPADPSDVSDTRQGQSADPPLATGSGLPGQGDGTADTGTEPGGATSPHGVGETGTGDGQGGSFQRPGGIRILERLTGELSAGPIHTGQVQASFGGEGGSGSAVAAPSPIASQAGEAQAVWREGVPLAYRETVRRYFQSLEPTASQ